MSSNKMSNNNNGDYDPDPSSRDLPETSDDDNSELTIPPPEVPYVSRYGMANAKNSLHDVELFRATLFNLKTEPVEDRERRYHETNSIFLRRCREPEEIDLIDEPKESLQPEEPINEVKSETIDEIEEDTSLLYCETEPLDYLPDDHPESTESRFYIGSAYPRANDLLNSIMFLQQRREPEEEMDEINDIPTENSSHINTTEIETEPLDYLPDDHPESTESRFYIGSAYPRTNVLLNSIMFLQQRREPEEEMDEINDIPTENSSHIDTTEIETEPLDYLPDDHPESTESRFYIGSAYPRANELLNNIMFLQQRREPEEEMDEINDIPTENSSHINTTEIETEPLDYLPDDHPESTESRFYIGSAYPRENELENNRMFLQQRREPEEEMDEINNIPLVVPPVLEPEEINETNTELVEPEAIDELNTTTETPSPIDTTTNPRASDMDNGNANITENPASGQRKTQKKKDVILTPTRVSTRIKKPRIMYNI